MKILSENDLIKKFHKNKLILLRTKPINKKEDVAGAKMLKAFHFIEKNLIFNGFNLIESDMLWHSSSALFYYVLKSDKLPNTITLTGPPLKIKGHVLLFKKFHKKTFIKNKTIFAIELRKYPYARDLVKNIIKTSNIKENVNNIKLI